MTYCRSAGKTPNSQLESFRDAWQLPHSSSEPHSALPSALARPTVDVDRVFGMKRALERRAIDLAKGVAAKAAAREDRLQLWSSSRGFLFAAVVTPGPERDALHVRCIG